MQYATLGNTGLVVSRLAFGAMTFTSGNQDYATVYKVAPSWRTSWSGARSMPE